MLAVPADEAHVHNLVSEIQLCDDPPLVAADVEHDPAVGQQVSRVEGRLYLDRALPTRALHNGRSCPHRQFCRLVAGLVPEGPQGGNGDNPHIIL